MLALVLLFLGGLSWHTFKKLESVESGLCQIFSFSAKIYPLNSKTIKTALHFYSEWFFVSIYELFREIFVAIYAVCMPIFFGQNAVSANFIAFWMYFSWLLCCLWAVCRCLKTGPANVSEGGENSIEERNLFLASSKQRNRESSKETYSWPISEEGPDYENTRQKSSVYDAMYEN